ncbi:PAS domain-containing protein [Hyunsoonleella sp. SJ7]|uniref:PAS domain-containing protein n=1 Tax=Hyunsoonleella aquatilis TaxID=2762758 RepID=A0A923HDD3_9FLAO|nr:LuxR C-terminal-related transcriptional regulator [Hyunsoonleella aquatilis]MBC3759101.1 PAS domain-containing protein [Hyunsoonleella aquatilis]
MNENARKVTRVWETENKILNPNKKEVLLDVVDQVASLFSAGPFYYYIINFEDVTMDYVHDGIVDVLGVQPEEFSVDKLFKIMHPDDLEVMHKKEGIATHFLFNDIPVENIPDYKVVYLMRLRHTSGVYKTILHQTKVLVMSHDGKIQKVLGIHTDVSHLNTPFDNKVSFISQKYPSVHFKYSKGNYVLREHYSTDYTKREIEILKLLSQGKTAQHISEQLSISLLTVNTHKRNILRKSGAINTSQLVAKAIREGII